MLKKRVEVQILPPLLKTNELDVCMNDILCAIYYCNTAEENIGRLSGFICYDCLFVYVGDHLGNLEDYLGKVGDYL